MPSPLDRCLFFLLIATMVWSAAMGFEASKIAPVETEDVPSGCYFSGTPILDVELAKTPECLTVVATQGPADKLAQNLKLFRVNTYMDFLFILLYWGVFVLFAQVEKSRWTDWIIGFISVSAVFDVLENWRILTGLARLASSEHLDGLMPRYFSLAKWVLLGVALALAGFLVWSRQGRFPRLLAVALVVSGVLTIVGLGIPKAMVYGGYGFAACFLLILARAWPYPADQVLLWVEYAYLLRFQIAAAAVLAVALPLDYYLVPSLFVGAFDGLNKVSFLVVVWAAFQLAWTVLVTSRLVFVYGPVRFPRATSIKPKRVGAGVVAAFGFLALPVVAVLFVGTVGVGSWSKVVSAILGLLLGVGVLALTAWLHFKIEDPGNSAEFIFPSFGFRTKSTQPKSAFWLFVGKQLTRILPQDLQNGILDITGAAPRLRSGHEMAAIAVLVFVLLYAFLGVVFSPAWARPESQPAALFFLLLILTILTWLFSGAAFFLDRTRLPVFSTLLIVSLLLGTMGTDHKFVVREQNAAEGKISPADVISKWKDMRSRGSKTVLVVATAGGGIRAAAWTAEVMTRLEQGCSAASDSLVLVSSVSGGSVGSMFVVAPYSGGKYPSTDQDLSAVRFNAKRSSLSAVGWGLAYPDLARTLPVIGSVIVPQTLDRGWSLENAWATGWRETKQEAPRMTQWREDVRNGLRPAVIFNGTASESGERFLIASTDAPFAGAKQFFELFRTKDIDVPTAARLSATFPYASPLARASAGSWMKAYHVGDGGYYDNSGLLSVVEWLDEARGDLQGYQVLLILIDARPGPEKPGSLWSWQRQLAGPIQTLLNVRSSSQQVRESIELKMAVKYLMSGDSDSKEHAQLAGRPEPLVVTPEPFLFWSPTDPDPPLSWHLTDPQKKEIGGAWSSDDNQKSWHDVRAKLSCPVDPEILKKAQEGSDE